LKPGNVPTAIIGPKLAMLVRDRWPHGGGIVVLAEKVGCDPSAIEAVIEQINPGVSFDLADKMFCALGRPMEDVGLADLYWSVEFRETCALHSCGKVFPEMERGSIKRYCSQKCRKLDDDIRRGRANGHRYRQKNRCLKGHLLTPENTVTFSAGNRTCRKCRRERQARQYRERYANDPVFAEKQRARARKKAAA